MLQQNQRKSATASASAGPEGASASAGTEGPTAPAGSGRVYDQAGISPEARLQNAGDQFGQALSRLSPEEKADMRKLKEKVWKRNFGIIRKSWKSFRRKCI